MNKITLLIANYNNGDYLFNNCLPSLFNQTSDRWTAIIGDDNSTDGSFFRWMLSHDMLPKELMSKIDFIAGKENVGYTNVLIGLLNEIVGNEIVGILDADDALTPTAIQKVMEYYDAHPEAEFVYTNFWYCDDKTGKRNLGYCRQIPPGRSALECDCVSHFKTFKMSAYKRCGGYDSDPSMLYAEDKDIIMKMEEVTQLHFINEPLYLLRRGHANAVNSDKLKREIGKTSHEQAKRNAIERRRTQT